MNRDTFVDDILHGGNRSIGATLLRGQLSVLSFLHRVGLELYLLPYNTGVRKRYRLNVPVIAIGNLSSGGTGKTPMAILIARYLQRSGQRVVVLSRGHGGSSEAASTPRIVSDGEKVLLTPTEAGDEPVLLANLLPGIPVVVCRDRRKSGRLAVETFAPDVLVCDDALQYWQLHRDLDIVLLDARRPFDNGYVLPRGLLREPPAHLARAGIVVLTRSDRVPPEVLSATRTQVQSLAPHASVFAATHAPISWVDTQKGTLPLAALQGKRALIFSGIADGRAFVETVEHLGLIAAAIEDFGDHHGYVSADEQRLLDAMTTGQCEVAVTTEKDFVKVAALLRRLPVPLYALRIGMAVRDEVDFFQRVVSVLPNPKS